MFNARIHKDFQNRREWPDEKLRDFYKLTSTTKGERVAITVELKARAGNSPRVGPKTRRQRAIRWALINANNTKGILGRAGWELLRIAKEEDSSEAEKLRIVKFREGIQRTVEALDKLAALEKELFPATRKPPKE